MNIYKLNHSKELMSRISIIALDKNKCKDVKYPILSSEKHTWYLAYINDLLVGFCAKVDKGDFVSFNHDYVLESHRGNGIYNELFKERLLDCNKKIKSTCNSKSLSTFIKNGFKIIKETKNYTFVELNK